MLTILMKNKNFFLFVFKVVTWICSHSDMRQSIPLHMFRKLCDRLHVVYTSRGLIFLIKYVKSLRCNTMNYLSGNPYRDSLSKCTKDGIPVFFGDLIPMIRSGSNREIALILTVLFSTRSFKQKPSPDFSSIIQP